MDTEEFAQKRSGTEITLRLNAVYDIEQTDPAAADAGLDQIRRSLGDDVW